MSVRAPQLQARLPSFKKTLSILLWRQKRFFNADEEIIVRAMQFVDHYGTLSEEAQQYVRVCPQCFAHQEVACAAVVPDTCSCCGTRTRHAPEFFLEVVLTDMSEDECDLRQNLGRC